MYCPICGAEYRPGFTTCSDCLVALVSDPPRKEPAESAEEHASFLTIWAGDDPTRHAQVCETLKHAEIPARTVRREDRSFNIAIQPAFEIFVPEEFADSAREIVKELGLSEEEADRLSASRVLEDEVVEDGELLSDEADNDGTDAEDDDRDYSRREDLLETDPGEASAEVWSGDDPDVAAMITASLRENRIPSRSEPPLEPAAADPYAAELHDAEPRVDEPHAGTASGETIRVFVFSDDARRAKKIIREILNATPPE
jgi:hypothetical protein